MEIDSVGLEEYMERHTEAEPEILRQLAVEDAMPFGKGTSGA